jgi:hypothetical protein
MKTLFRISWLALLMMCVSCVAYKHSHVNQDGTTDTTRFNSFLMLGSASKIRSATKEGTNYSRTVSVGALEGKGDTEMIQAIAAGIVEGLKKSQGVP